MKPALLQKLPMPLTKSRIIILIGSLAILCSIIAGIYVYTVTSHQEESQIIITPEEQQRRDEAAYILEQENIRIDDYNFGQLEKAKLILDKIGKDGKSFLTLSKFNELYNTNITPIKNCYYVDSSNGEQPYIFGFQLYSDVYKKKYGTTTESGMSYYAYPKYDLPNTQLCFGADVPGLGAGSGGGCYDYNYENFISTISTPCKD